MPLSKSYLLFFFILCLGVLSCKKKVDDNSISKEEFIKELNMDDNGFLETPQIDYQFPNKYYDEIYLVGIEYNMPIDPDKLAQQQKAAWVEFLKEDFYNSIQLADKKLYVYFHSYSKSGFKIFFGYSYSIKNNVSPTINTTLKTIPAGNFATFKFDSEIETSYQDAWKIAEQANSSRSFKADLEVYEMDWKNMKTKNGEIRLHLK